MRIDTIEIKNIGAHTDTTIDFDALGPVVAITGRNGSGKTFLLESVPATLYGAFPTRPGSLYDRITTGYQGEASMAVSFQMDGAAFRAERTLRRKGKTTSSEAYLYKDGEIQAGPKVTDVEQAVRTLLGPQELFLSSVFSSQKNTGDLCDAKPAERKAVFARMLGLERMDEISRIAKDKVQVIETNTALAERDIKLWRETTEDIEETRAQWDKVVRETKEFEIESKELDRQIKNLEDKVRIGEVAAERWRGLVKRVEALNTDIERAEAEIEADRAEYKRTKELADCADKTGADQGRVDGLRQEKDLLQKRKAERDLIEAEIARGRAEITGIEREIAQLKRQAEPIKNIPGEKCCEGCALVKGAYQAKNEIPGREEALKVLRAAAEDKTRRAETEDPVEELAKVEGELRKLAGIEQEHARAVAAKERLDQLAEAGRRKKDALEARRAEWNNAVRDTQAARAEIPGDDAAKESELVRGKAEVLAMKVRANTGRVAELAEKVRAKEDAKRRADDAEGSVAKDRGDVVTYRTVSEAFGRSGIQPLIIDQARPEIEDIANGMLKDATGGRMGVRFDTQKTLKSGEIAESLDIIISMDGAERDIGEFSGGEQKLLRTVIRLALAVWQARKGGCRLRTLFIDEVFDSLDANNSDKVLGILHNLQGQFDRIILISHDDDLLEDLPARVELGKKSKGT